MQIQFVNWDTDQASLTVRGASPAFSAAQWAYKDKITVWRDGARFFQGWVVGLGLSAQTAESRTYTLAGPSWWLANLPFVWPYWPAKDSLDLGERAAGLWIAFALDSAIAAGAPIAKDSGGYSAFSLPTPDLRASSTCLEAIQRAARLFPMSAGWWDYSGTTPILRAKLRAGLTAQTLALGTDVETFGFTPLPDQQVISVALHFAYPVGDGTTATVIDSAGTTPLVVGVNRLHCTLDVENAERASEAAGCGIASLLHASLSPLAWSGAVNLHEGAAPLPSLNPGHALSLTGGRSEWATMSTCIQSVAWSVQSGAGDLCTIQLGAPEHLGPQDYLDFARAGVLSGGAGGGNPSPYTPPTPPPIPPGDAGTTPGTYPDLMRELFSALPEIELLTSSMPLSCYLYGFSENVGHVSTPPRFYLDIQLSGAWVNHITGFDFGWTPCDRTDSMSWSGTSTINPTTGAQTVGGQVVVVTSAPGGGTSTTSCVELVAPLGSWDYPFTFDSVESTTRSGAIHPRGTLETVWTLSSESGSITNTTSGSGVETRGSENTESSEIARKSAAAEWGAYSTAEKIGNYTERTDRAFSRTRLRYKSERKEDIPGWYALDGPGGIQQWHPGTTYAKGTAWGFYRVAVLIYRRAIGAPWPATPSETIQYQLQCDSAGVLAAIPEIEVDCERGQEVKVTLGDMILL